MAKEKSGNRRKKAGAKRKIQQYDHRDKKRVNNPPVGLVTPETDPLEILMPERPKGTYAYDPHLDPELGFDSQSIRQHVSDTIAEGLADEPPDDDHDNDDETAHLLAERDRAREALKQIETVQQPYLNWAGKAERTSFETPTVSLHVHERIDPKTIIHAVRARNGNGNGQMSMFESPDENPPLRDAVEFYKHRHNWTNRLIAGDSLLVMNSLLEKEGLAGQVQVIYIDPPYGIRYGSNFQPFVNKRDVKDGKDEDLTQEPETLKAFRDTWELGIHSYLTYLRDRLLLARELLHETGSCFVQISDENLHYVRVLMDEVFGASNLFSLIAVRKTGGLGAGGLPAVCDYLVWYCKDRSRVKFRQLYRDKTKTDIDAAFQPVSRLQASIDSGRISGVMIPNEATAYITVSLTSSGHTTSCIYPYEFQGTTYHPVTGFSWKPNRDGMQALERAGRLIASGSTLRWVYYREDFPVSALTNSWDDTGGATGKTYVVQTSTKVIERCLLMATDPGDLVFDPTCGSGTTAYVAEQWGRRWITTDTSRVATTLAKQRLMTAVFDYYKLAHPDQGVGSGFKYKTVPHVSLKSIANNPEITEGMSCEEIDAAIAKYADPETLYDQPEKDRTRARVTGPFTAEAVPAPVFGQPEVRPIEPIDWDDQSALPGMDDDPHLQPDASVAREGVTLHQSEWRDELLKTGIRAKSGNRIEFVRVEPLPSTRWLSADAETKEDTPRRAVISFGPEHAPLEQRQVAQALEEANSLVPRPVLVIFAALQFDPEASKDIDETNWPGVTLLKAQMNGDLVTEDLKKKRLSNESFWLIGQPDIRMRRIDDGEHAGCFQVEVHGFDYFNPKTGTVDSGGASSIAMWMLDTDYDGRSLYARQVFFPMAGPKDGWARLANTLKTEIEFDLIERYRGTVSLPFEAGEYGRIAVKIVDDRGIESVTIRSTRDGDGTHGR